jgi:ATP-binding cassette, subfamily B (MDR/TAP), member 1
MAVLIGAFALGQVGPNFAAFAGAQAAGYKLFEIIDRVPAIDVKAKGGKKPPVESLSGTIEFKGVT